MGNNPAPAPIPTPIPAPVPEPAPVPPAAPPPPAAPAPVPPQPQQSSGGGTSIRSWFDGITFIDVAVYGLVSLALFYSIHYNRSAMFALKTSKAQAEKDIDELRSNVQSFMGPNYKKF